MLPRCACLLLFLMLLLSGVLVYAAEEPKPSALPPHHPSLADGVSDALPETLDPDRFNQPLIRVWIPSTLAGDYREFRESVRRDANSEDAAEQIQSDPVTPEDQPVRVTREGILVYFDPARYRPSKYYEDWQRNAFPGSPWLKPVRFFKVANREGFEEEVRRRTRMNEDDSGGILEVKDRGFVYSKNAFSYTLITTAADLDYYLNQTSHYWTYRDGYMFFGDFEEILTMEFPSPRDLDPKGTDADRDVFVQVDLNAVLPRQKRILWDLVRKELERSLQQYDDEGDAQYAFRKSVGDLQLNLIQAVTNDLESIKLGIDFASEDQPAKAELEFVARPRVNLERYFGKSGIGTPALAAFVEEPAAMTLATSWGLPERVVATLEKFLQVVDAQLDQQQGWTLDAILASQELAQDLLETIRGNHQLAVKLTQTEHGFTVYGGLRIRNPGRVSKNLAIVLNGLTGRDGWGVLQSRDSSGRTYYSFRPSDLTKSVTNHRRRSFPAELHFTVVDEILWFSAGRQDSLDVLAQSLDRIEEQQDPPVRSSTPLALIDVSLDKMFPEKDLDETEGFDRVPLAMVQTLDGLIPRRGNSSWNTNWVTAVTFSQSMRDAPDLVVAGNQAKLEDSNADDAEWKTIVQYDLPMRNGIQYLSFSPDGTPLTQVIQESNPMPMQKFLQPDQSRIRIQFDAGEKRMKATATVSLGVIKHIYARMMESGLTDIERYFLSLDAAEASKNMNIEADVKIYTPADLDAPD